MAIRAGINGFGRSGHQSLKVIAWHDNEWGYSRRVANLTNFVGERL